MASLWKCVGTRGSLVHEGTLMGQDVPGTAIPYAMCCCTASTCAYTGREPVRDDGGQVANTERAVCLGCNKRLRLNKSCWVAEAWHVKCQGGLCCAHIFGVLHIHTWCMCVVLTQVDAELHSQRESHFGWLC